MIPLGGGALDGVRLWRPRTNDVFTQRAQVVLGSSRALGFDTPAPGSSAGELFSQDAIGHDGFTGTSAWADLSRDLIVVCLTNRVHPSRDDDRIDPFRRALHDLVVRSIGD